MVKILIIQTAFIGDAILTLPMIQKLKVLFPESEIDVLAIPLTAEIFTASPHINRVLIIDKKGKQKSIFSLLKFVGEIKKNNYAKVYAPHRSLRTSLIVMNIAVKESFGFSTSSFKHVYTKLQDYIPQHHEVQRNLDLINYDYKDDWKILPDILISRQEKEKIDNLFSTLNAKPDIAAVAPGSVWNTKIYPEPYYRTLIKYFIAKSFTVLLIGSEKEKFLCDNIAAHYGGEVISAAGKFSLIETIELIKRSKILISNDSAPTHLGMCANIPILTLYCSTVPEFGFYPYNKGSYYLSFNDLKCKPCGIHGFKKCPVKTFACGYNLNPATVISKIEGMLNDRI
jgi:heptosyltransferase-2